MRPQLPPSVGGDGRRNPKASELIARGLANHIIDSNLAEGSMLPTEREMVETLGVGRTTLREALRLLETRGVLRIRPGPRGGPVVRRPRPADLGAALTLILQFEGASLADVMDARETLEPTIARLAASRVTDEQLAELAKYVRPGSASEDDPDAFLHENERFHSLVAEASRSVVLQVFSDSLKSIADGAFAGVKYSPIRRRAVLDAHARVLRALQARDGAEAELAMRAHLEEARRYWESKYPDLMARPVHWVH